MTKIAEMRSIYLADDDSDDRELFAEALKSISLNVDLVVVENGQELITALEQVPPPEPSVIFLDINMPVKDGNETLRYLKSNEKFSVFPVVIFSTACDHKTVDTFYRIGADYYICKPDSYQKLQKLITKVLSLIIRGQKQVAREEFMLAY